MLFRWKWVHLHFYKGAKSKCKLVAPGPLYSRCKIAPVALKRFFQVQMGAPVHLHCKGASTYILSRYKWKWGLSLHSTFPRCKMHLIYTLDSPLMLPSFWISWQIDWHPFSLACLQFLSSWQWDFGTSSTAWHHHQIFSELFRQTYLTNSRLLLMT